MSTINDKQIEILKTMYFYEGLSMREVADRFGVNINSVIYFMRKHHIKRRSFSEINKLRFENKPLSFELKPINTRYLQELKIAGSMLYWGEGYKSEKGASVDFANSDPEMILMFLNYLRRIYQIDENRLRVLLYCYENQEINKLITFWSGLTNIPKKQFSKPYIRKDFRPDSIRKMKNGLIHVRYSDKKLLLEIKKTIKQYVNRYQSNNAGVREVVKPSGL
jgi:predicted DNA-binding protein YlxM (UPF0122 family)